MEEIRGSIASGVRLYLSQTPVKRNVTSSLKLSGNAHMQNCLHAAYAAYAATLSSPNATPMPAPLHLFRFDIHNFFGRNTNYVYAATQIIGSINEKEAMYCTISTGVLLWNGFQSCGQEITL